MRFILVTPERLILDTEVDEVYAPGVMGEFGVLPLHVNFLTILDTGELRYRVNGVDRYAAVSGGVLEVLGDTITLLADSAELVEEIDVARAKASELEAQAALAAATAGTPEATALAAAVARAHNRQVIAERRVR